MKSKFLMRKPHPKKKKKKTYDRMESEIEYLEELDEDKH